MGAVEKPPEIDKLVLIDLPDVDYEQTEHREHLLKLVKENSANLTTINFESNGVNVTKDLLLLDGTPAQLARMCPTIENFGYEEFNSFADLHNFYRIEDDLTNNSFYSDAITELNQALINYACVVDGECRLRSLIVDQLAADNLSMFPYVAHVKTVHLTQLHHHFTSGSAKANLKALSFKYDAKFDSKISDLATLVNDSPDLRVLILDLCDLEQVGNELEDMQVPNLEHVSIECSSALIPKLGKLKPFVKVLIVDKVQHQSDFEQFDKFTSIENLFAEARVRAQMYNGCYTELSTSVHPSTAEQLRAEQSEHDSVQRRES